FHAQVHLGADYFACAAVYAVFQRHTMLSHIIDDVDAMHFSSAIGHARSGLAEHFVALDAVNANRGVELIDMFVAFVILRCRVENGIRAGINGALVVMWLIIFWCYKGGNDVLVIGFVFDWADVELALDQTKR